ncbi:hypothetical protein JTB14_003379 [Gonioctena quinquepunctata]|nr:hypothetical protein JTB14_003379 [Gonioctena quinquepunctata]
MGFPNVLGVIDGSHIKIDTPAEDSVSYFNGKNIIRLMACYVLHSLAIKEDINWDQTSGASVADNPVVDEDDEENSKGQNEPGHAFRNYIASILND